MYEVKSAVVAEQFDDLAQAMEFAKGIGVFVTITGHGMEIVGRFGADSVEDGVCPDGVAYDWMKRRSQ